MSYPRSIEQRGASHAVLANAPASREGAARERAPATSFTRALSAFIAASFLLSACATLDNLPIPGRKKSTPAPTTSSTTSSSGGTISNTPTSAPPAATPSDSPAAPPKPAPTVDEKGRSLFGFGRKKKAAPPTETASGTAAVKPAIAVPPQARAEFDRAVGLMRSGKDVEAQLEFARIAKAYPQFASPDVNLGILYRKSNNLEKSEEALQEAVSRNRDSAVAWTELGVTQRQRGDFKSAQDSYENAIRVDPDYAPAYRNLGVLLDLYVGDAEGALDNFERYKELSKEEKPVTSWIAELRARTGKPPIRKQPVAPASDSAPVDGSNDNSAPPGVSGEAAPASGVTSDGGAPGDGAASSPGAPADGGVNPTAPANGNGPAAASPPGVKPAEPKRG